jgi:hypothetical protein
VPPDHHVWGHVFFGDSVSTLHSVQQVYDRRRIQRLLRSALTITRARSPQSVKTILRIVTDSPGRRTSQHPPQTPSQTDLMISSEQQAEVRFKEFIGLA